MTADLHTHTTASDGSLTPAQLRAEACAAGISLLAITDHDTTAAMRALERPDDGRLTIIPGVEFSTRWQRQGVHIVGLNIDSASSVMHSACATQSEARDDRALAIAERLEKHGIDDSYAGARAYAAGGAIGRPHFARYLVSIGAVATPAQAFKKFLGGAGDAGGIGHWPSMATAVEWIRDAGGTPVLAHPAKYRLTRSRLGALASAFRDAGGGAIEVISGQQKVEVTTQIADLARRYKFAASTGSDFHEPGRPWAALGRLEPLPGDLTPVWDTW